MSKKSSYELGDELENLAKDFFEWLFEKLSFSIVKSVKNKSGTQFGFDVELMIVKDFLTTRIFIECKNYSSIINRSQAFEKLEDFINTRGANKNDIFIFLSPHNNFSNIKNLASTGLFVEKFETNVLFLTPANYVKNLFALSPRIYRKIYNAEAIEIDKNKELKRFSDLISIIPPIKKMLKHNDSKKEFIDDLKVNNFHIKRTVSRSQIQSENIYNEEGQNLFDLVRKSEKNKFILLGNPGSGKSAELHNIANKLWENFKDFKFIPIYKKLKYFSSTNEIEKILPDGWIESPNLFLLFDGFDEISDKGMFINKLEEFIKKYSQRSIKYLLSSRTNHFTLKFDGSSLLLEDFECYFLDPMDFKSCCDFLQYKYLLSAETIAKSYNYNNQKYFQNPYYLDILGKYLSENNVLPNNFSQIYENIIQERLYTDTKKYVGKGFDIFELKEILLKNLYKIAIVNEAQQTTLLENSYFQDLVKSDNELLKHSLLINKILSDSKIFWEFEHKDLQEFFAAKFLSGLEFEQIISFIKIDADINKTHPSWFNAISHLIGNVDSNHDNYKELLNWILVNEPFILFKADENKIDVKIRNSVFKNQFEKVKKERLWLNSYPISISDWALFGNTPENFSYLLNEINNSENHKRIKINIIEILGYFKMDITQRTILKQTFKSLLNSKNNDGPKARVLEAIINQEFTRDSKYIDEIIYIVSNTEDEHINYKVYEILYTSKLYNKHYKIVVNGLKNELGLRDRLGKMKFATDSFYLEKCIKQLTNTTGIAELINIYLTHDVYHLDADKHFNTIINNAINLQNKNRLIYSSFIVIILRAISKSSSRFRVEEEFIKFFIETKTNKKAFTKILNFKSASFDEVIFILRDLLTSDDQIKEVVNFIKNNNIEYQSALSFRNLLTYKKNHSHKLFESLINENTSYHLDNFVSHRPFDWNSFRVENRQRNFDLLFNPQKLEETVLQIFNQYYIKSTITFDELYEIKKEKWHKKRREFNQENIEHERILESLAFSLLRDLCRSRNNIIKYVEVEEWFEMEKNYEYYRIVSIYDYLNQKNSDLNVSQKQEMYIYAWCESRFGNLDFKNAIKYKDNSQSFTINQECLISWFFRERFDFTYPEEDLLNMLSFDSTYLNYSKNLGLDYIIKNVAKEKVDKRIIKNLEDGITESYVILNHFDYIFKYDMIDYFILVEKYSKDNKTPLYVRENVLKQYIQRVKKVDFLSTLIESNSDLKWLSLDLIQKFKKYDILERQVNVLLKANNDSKDEIVLIGYLIKINNVEAFKLFIEWYRATDIKLKNGINYAQYFDDFCNKNILDFIFPFYEENLLIDNDRLDSFRNSRNICENVLKNIIIKHEEYFDEILCKLNQMLNRHPENDNIIFYVNNMKRTLQTQYITQKSKPMTFKEIKNKLREVE